MSGEQTDWPEKAGRLAARFPRSSLHPEVCRWFEGKSGSGPFGVTCSGGADSLCLLLLLWGHFPERRDDLVVLHFDHRLRREDSTADAVFVEEVARSLGVKVRVEAWDRAAGAPVSEEAARKARFAFFHRALAEEKGAGAEERILFFGHQRDDVVESQLMRLSRGSGTAGLAAPRPVQEFSGGGIHLRPLLLLGAGEIRRALADLEIRYRVDASNAGLGFYRNRLRLEVLPVWQKHSPFDVPVGAAASRELLQEDEEALEAWLREAMPRPVAGQALDLGPLKEKPRALLRRALREWLRAEELTDNLSKAAFDRLLDAAAEGAALRMSAGPAAFLELAENGCLRKTAGAGGLAPAFDRPWPLPPTGAILLPGGRSLQARRVGLDPAARERILGGGIDPRTEAFLLSDEPLRVRHWERGDRFHALGAPGSRKLQDIFVDLKIVEGERYLLPVVFDYSKILWVPSLPPADASKVSSRSKTVVRLTYNWGEAV